MQISLSRVQSTTHVGDAQETRAKAVIINHAEPQVSGHTDDANFV